MASIGRCPMPSQFKHCTGSPPRRSGVQSGAPHTTGFPTCHVTIEPWHNSASMGCWYLTPPFLQFYWPARPGRSSSYRQGWENKKVDWAGLDKHIILILHWPFPCCLLALSPSYLCSIVFFIFLLLMASFPFWVHDSLQSGYHLLFPLHQFLTRWLLHYYWVFQLVMFSPL